ncbi:hypothetical protein [Halobaculum litoreum]|uniref:Uncharacterized protein n=1 Tax=Halobaculum litoreum TaxID=3031998 RepID=A0ABD5XWN3_9EURY|nr:hypothetical protein [Halobaculum sp. DT92]
MAGVRLDGRTEVLRGRQRRARDRPEERPDARGRHARLQQVLRVAAEPGGALDAVALLADGGQLLGDDEGGDRDDDGDEQDHPREERVEQPAGVRAGEQHGHVDRGVRRQRDHDAGHHEHQRRRDGPAVAGEQQPPA